MTNRFSIKLITLAAIAMFAGCAGPSIDVMKNETANFQLPKLPDSGKAMVYVVRPASVGALIRFNVFVDDKEAASEMGYTRGNQYIYFHVTPGDHTIYSKAENWADAKISAKPGDILFIHQIPAMGLVMARNSLTTVPDYEGKYHVKNTGLGTIIKLDK